MTDRPYTDADLRAEAARQYATATEDPDFMGIGEMMDGTEISSLTTEDEPGVVEGTTWDELSPEDFDAAQRAIDELLGKAADVSEWAIHLGADGLEPSDGCLSLKGDDKPIVRIHFAFDPDMPDEMREALIRGVGEEIARYV